MNAALRVAMFTPLPPARTGTAEYGEQLARELQKLVQLRVFDSTRGVSLKNFDAVIYHIANNPHHADIYEMALRHPGITVLHETNLHDLIKGFTLNQGGEGSYLREVVHEIFGEDLEVLSRESLFEVPQPRAFTTIRRILAKSKGCIVHSNHAERTVRQKGFSGPVAVIPHGAAIRNIDGRRYRTALGIEADAPLIGVFGYHRPDKREFECFHAFRKLLDSYPNAHLLVVGEPHSEVPMKQWIQECGLENQVHLLDYAPIEDYDGYLSACDVVLNLRSPSFGETSGTMMRAFGLGKAVILSETGSSQELPDDVCMRIPPDQYEGRVLLECLKWLFEEPSRIEEAGLRAQLWAESTCAWPLVAGMYAEFARTVAEGGTASGRLGANLTSALDAAEIDAYLRRWIEPASDAEGYYRVHRHRLARTLQLTPRGGAGARVLEMGCYLQMTPALQKVLGYGTVRGCYLGKAGVTERREVVAQDGESFECAIDLFNAETDRFPYADGHFATVLCCELLEHLEHDPMHLMWEIHRILAPGGILVLTTPNAVSLHAIHEVLSGRHPASFRRYSRPNAGGEVEPGHSREYTPDEIRLLMADAGFIVLSVETGRNGENEQHDVAWIPAILKKWKLPIALRGETIFSVCRKEPITKKRYPTWLYGE